MIGPKRFGISAAFCCLLFLLSIDLWAGIQASSSMHKKVLAQANSCTDPNEGLELFETFQNVFELNQAQARFVSKEHKKWSSYVKQDKVRNGSKWISRKKYESDRIKTLNLIAEAKILLSERKIDESIELLEQAKKLDKNDIEAAFILGIIYSPLTPRNNRAKSRSNFEQALKRSPHNVSLLNNLALAELREDDHNKAEKYWKQALLAAPASFHVVHNIDYLVREIERGAIQIIKKKQNRLTALKALVSPLPQEKIRPQNEINGWIYMPLYSGKQQTGDGAIPVNASSEILPVCFENGFVIHKNYVVTSSRMVHHPQHGKPDAITTWKNGQKIQFNIVAVSQESGIAILKSPVSFPAFSEFSEDMDSQTEYMILRHNGQLDQLNEPEMFQTKIAHQIMDKNKSDVLLVQATRQAKTSGSPILNSKGQVIGLHSQTFRGLNLDDIGCVEYDYCLSIKDSLPFLSLHIPNFKIDESSASSVYDWEALKEKYQSAVLPLYGFKQTQSLSSTQDGKIWQDTLCNACRGTKKMDCPNKTCHKGTITTRKYFDEYRGIGSMRRLVPILRTVKERCSTCSGSGLLSCPYCR